MILGDKIMNLRKQNNWSQEDLAEKLGISRQSVSKWESGTSIPDIDKIIKLSAIFDVSTDYLLKDELEEILPSETEANDMEKESLRRVSLEEVSEYTGAVSVIAVKIAMGVALCILSAAVLIGFQILAVPLPGVSGGSALLSEQAAGSLGTVLLLLLCAGGVILLVSNGMKISKYEFFETEELNLDYGVKGVIEKKKSEFEPVYRRCVTIGTALCIISVVPLMVAASLDASDYIYLMCTTILLVIIAIAVFIFVWSGMIQGSYNKVLQVGDYTPENKRLNKKVSWFSGAYWCTVVAIYLGISFVFNNWHISWIVWPVAGVLFAALYQIVRHRAQKNSLE